MGVALAVVLALASPAAAQSRREMQMMADIRMLQEQTQQLQQQMTAALEQLTATLKTINARVDEQAGATRKSFADQKLAVDQFGSDLRVVRERIDENNVRITQPVAGSRSAAAGDSAIPAAPPARAGRSRCGRRAGTPTDPAASGAAAPPPVALAPGHVAAAALQHRARRFHRRPMGAVHRRLQHLPAQLLAHRPG